MIIIKSQFLQLQASLFDPGILSQQRCNTFSCVAAKNFCIFLSPCGVLAIRALTSSFVYFYISAGGRIVTKQGYKNWRKHGYENWKELEGCPSTFVSKVVSKCMYALYSLMQWTALQNLVTLMDRQAEDWVIHWCALLHWSAGWCFSVFLIDIHAAPLHLFLSVGQEVFCSPLCFIEDESPI